MIKGVTHAHLGPIWYHSESSDVPYSQNQFLGWDFFCSFLHQDGSKKLAEIVCIIHPEFFINLKVEKSYILKQVYAPNLCSLAEKLKKTFSHISFA